MAATVTIDWGEHDLAPSDRRSWLAAWLVDREGVEGEFFYDGRGGEVTTHPIPEHAVGFRLRCWPPETGSQSAGQRPYATKPFWFDTYDGATLKALELP
jgi:hypothetical protein